MPDTTYTGTEQHRVWQVWIESAIAGPVLELEIRYPADMVQGEDGLGYLFRLAMKLDSGDADHLNNTLNGELKEQDDSVLTGDTTRLLTLAIPDLMNR